jgi:3-(3-hydroxy-phenyl)propionate hydroxylase
MSDKSAESGHFDVVIIGGGPVGTTTALKLANAGMDVLILEERESLGSERRATTFHPPTLEMLNELGLADSLIEEGIVCTSYQFRDAKKGMIVDLDFNVLQGETAYPFRLQVEQSRLTRLALEALETHPRAKVVSSSPVSSVVRANSGVEVHVESGPFRGILRAPIVIGADGSKSVVRESLGIGFNGLTYPERYLVISTTLALHEIFPDISNVNYVTDPVDWHVMLRNPSGWRVLFPMPFDGTSDEDLLAEDNVMTNLKRVVPDASGYPVSHVTLYQIHRKVADTFRDGSVFLVGDAAHVNNPLGGMGMNSGIHDGIQLAEVLIQQFQGKQVDEELDAWAERRRNVALDYVGKETDANWSALREPDEEARARQQDYWTSLSTDEDARREFLRVSSMLSSIR